MLQICQYIETFYPLLTEGNVLLLSDMVLRMCTQSVFLLIYENFPDITSFLL